MFAVQRHASIAILLFAGAESARSPRQGVVAVLTTVAVYLLVNRRWGRMAATAAGFLFVCAVGSGAARAAAPPAMAAWALASVFLGVGSSLAYQRAEARYLIPWARRRTPFLLERTRRATLFWSAALVAVTLGSLGLARLASR